MKCGLQIELPLDGIPSQMITLKCGLRIFFCRVNHLENWPHHERDYQIEVLEELLTQVKDTFLKEKNITELQFNTACSKVVVCLSAHPLEYQEREDKAGLIPVCFKANNIDLSKVKVVKLPSTDISCNSVPVWHSLLEKVVEKVATTLDKNVVSAEVSRIRSCIDSPKLETNIKNILAIQDAAKRPVVELPEIPKELPIEEKPPEEPIKEVIQ